MPHSTQDGNTVVAQWLIGTVLKIYKMNWLAYGLLTLCSRVVNLIKYPLMPGRFKFFECSTPKCTVTYILTL
jgi:hypothetical protein